MRQIPDSVVKEIAGGYASREINRVLATLGTWSPSMSKLTLPQKNAGPMLAFFAWAMDMAPTFVPIVETLVRRFKEEVPKISMTLCDLVYLNMAEGLLNLHYGRYENAIANFELAEFGADQTEDTELQIVAKYYLGRVFLKTASYRRSLPYIRDSKKLDHQPKRSAVTKSIEGLLHLLLGETEEAELLLNEAEAALRGSESDDAEVRGNICMFRARIKRRLGQYVEAEKKYNEGIGFYEQRDKHHRNIARACVHLAVIKRGQAVDFADEKPGNDGARKMNNEKMKACWLEAHRYLTRAERIYNLNLERNTQEIAKAKIARALLFLDMGIYSDKKFLGEAERIAGKAFHLGQQKNDNLVISKVRTVQCRLALLEQHRGHDLRALNLANEAVAYAEETDYPRLKARAYIWQGQAHLRVLHDPLAAKKSLHAASTLLCDEDRDSLRYEFNELKEDIESYQNPAEPIVELRLSDLIKPISNDIEGIFAKTKKSHGKKESQATTDQEPEAKCYLRQIMDEVEEHVIRYLHGYTGNVNQVYEIWRVGRPKVRAAIATYALTESSLREITGRLDDTALQNSLDANEKNGVNQKTLARLKSEILKRLTKLKDQEVLGEANFIGLVSKAIGYRRAIALKPIIVECAKRPKLGANGEPV